MAVAWWACVCEEKGSTSAAVSKMCGAFHPVCLAGFGASHPLTDSAQINFEGVPFQIWVKTAPRAQLLPHNMCVSYPHLPSSIDPLPLQKEMMQQIWVHLDSAALPFLSFAASSACKYAHLLLMCETLLGRQAAKKRRDAEASRQTPTLDRGGLASNWAADVLFFSFLQATTTTTKPKTVGFQFDIEMQIQVLYFSIFLSPFSENLTLPFW